jgi:peptidoglycan/xylan/chitin deacetylase (PgdA/CDA1 family)
VIEGPDVTDRRRRNAPARRRNRPRRTTPRTHWLLLSVLAVTLSTALLLQGYTHHTFGIASDDATGARGHDGAVPSQVAHGGPVIANAATTPHTARVKARTIALTFDDGPDPAATPLFLDVLRERGVRATFFLLGSQVSRTPRLAVDIADAGHEIGVHGWRHRYLPLRGPGATHADLASTKEIIAATAGVDPWLFRPPYGVLSTAGLVAAGRLGLTSVLWNCWGREWARGATPETVFQTLAGDLQGGVTVLLHDSDCTAPAGSAQAALGALGLLLDECERRGLRVGPLGEHGPHWQAP